MSEYDQIHIESHMPKVWEQEETFNDVLYDWMSRAPWLAISAGLHVVVFFILLAIPWDMFKPEKEKIIVMEIPPPPPPIEEEIEEPEEEIEEVEEVEPVIQDFEVSDHNETESQEDFEEALGDPDQDANSPFDSDNMNNVIGVGGGAGGKFGGRSGGRKNLSARGGRPVAEAIKAGLEWLKKHQAEDGSWDVDEYWINNVSGGTTCDEGAGIASQDIGITGLALLAFLGDGSSTKQGEYRDVVKRGIGWLTEQQDEDTGLIGQEIGHGFVYDHAIATLALAENYYDSKSPFQKKTTQDALNLIGRARAPYGGWRYEIKSDGDTDTSITGWMIFALKAGDDAHLKIDKEAFGGALGWLDQVTDTSTGRVGYIGPEPGGRSSRTETNSDYPAELTEAMTGVGLLCRVFLGQTPQDHPIMNKHGDLLLRMLPEWDEKGHKVDMYYWYYGTYAMYQLAGDYWKKWKAAMEKAIIPHQRGDGDYKGSWDPVGPWGYQGGRVYSTATMVLTLEVFYRYSGLLGAR
ncbi:MAG: prenyltransferase/squalene oxidase repeat-containing protein [Planctomycetota bacterium]